MDTGSPLKKLNAEDVLTRISHIDILRTLPPEEIKTLIPYLEPIEFSKGTIIIEQGSDGDALYFLENGSTEIFRNDTKETWQVSAGSVIGEIALVTGAKRTATVTARNDVTAWRMTKASFDRVIAESPSLRPAMEALIMQRLKGITASVPDKRIWVSTALRAMEAQYRGLTVWQLLMGAGLLLWTGMLLNHRFNWINAESYHWIFAGLQLITGLLVLQGSCEGFISGSERLGARYKWDGFISGTVGSLLSTLPEFVVIAFLIMVEPLAAFVTAVVTIFNNALAFSVYAFFLPKDREGSYAMPRSLTKAGGEILIAGGAITLIVGIAMVIARVESIRTTIARYDLIIIGAVLMIIYIFYVLILVRYYGEGKDDENSLPPDPECLGHDTSWMGIGIMFFLGILGAYAGGEAIGGFAETAIKDIGLPTIPTAAALAFFAGISEYIIVYKSHRRGELGIALSNVFGGLSQVMFLLLPFGMIVIGIAGIASGNPLYSIPINPATSLLMLLLFPLFHTLFEYLEQNKINNLDAAAMTGIYILLLYFLFTYPN